MIWTTEEFKEQNSCCCFAKLATGIPLGMAVENVNLAVLGSSVGFKIPLKLWNIPRTRKDYNDKFKQTEVQEPNGKDSSLEHFWYLMAEAMI